MWYIPASQRGPLPPGGASPAAGAANPSPSPPATACSSGPAPSLPDGQPYDTGSPPRLLHLWVDPVAGSDSNSGASQAEALRTFTAAWGRIPPNRRLKRGRHIHILPGEFAEGQGAGCAVIEGSSCLSQADALACL